MLRLAKKEELTKTASPDIYFFYKFDIYGQNIGRAVLNIVGDKLKLKYLYQTEIRKGSYEKSHSYPIFECAWKTKEGENVYIGDKSDLAIFILTKEFPFPPEERQHKDETDTTN